MLNVLLVIDPQLVYFDPSLLPVTAPESLRNIYQLVEGLDAYKILVVHDAPGTPFASSEPTHEIADTLLDSVFDHKVVKGFASAFTKTDLGACLVAIGGEFNIIVCGYQSHHCVVATALEAAAYGNVFVVTDACSSPDIIEVCRKWERNPATPKCGLIPGEIAHDVAMASACQFYATPRTTAEVLSRFV